jgi:SAM-dependent methyltransferase
MSVQHGSIDVEYLRRQVQEKYTEVAVTPEKGFHFHAGRPLAAMLEYPEPVVDAIPSFVMESFAGVGNPFLMGRLPVGATVVDLGSGAGFDSLIAALQVGPTGHVIGIDMTDAMLEKARAGARAMGLQNVEFRKGLIEELPFPDSSMDVVISNGVVNLVPDKGQAYREVYRVLRPGGLLQIADVVVRKRVPPDAVEDIDLWTG